MVTFQFIGLVLVVALIVVGLSLLLMRIFKSSPMIKYIPVFLIWILSITLFIMGRFFAQPMQDLGYYVMSMITGMATFVALIVMIILERAERIKNDKNRKKKK